MNQHTNQEEIAALAQAEKYREQMELMRKLNSIAGFYHYFLDELKNPEHKTRDACFWSVNLLYENLFGVPRYSTYDSFQKSVKNYLK